jgi:hypothetical protein
MAMAFVCYLLNILHPINNGLMYLRIIAFQAIWLILGATDSRTFLISIKVMRRNQTLG